MVIYGNVGYYAHVYQGCMLGFVAAVQTCIVLAAMDAWLQHACHLQRSLFSMDEHMVCIYACMPEVR